MVSSAVDDLAMRAESQGPVLWGVALSMVIISGTILLMRLYTRLVLIASPGADDWTIILAMLFAIIVSVSTCMEEKYGMGRHKEAVSSHDTAYQLKYLYVSILHYNVGMNIVKISFLFQYRRIFQTETMQKICFWAIIGVIGWACLQAALLGTSCLPIAFIVPSTGSWCLDTLPVWYFSSAVSLVTDVLIFCLPLPSILKLQLKIRQKIMIMLIFCLGFFVCIISIYRIWTLREAVESEDPPWDNVGAAVWSVIELNCAIICASLPTLRPLVAKIVPGMSSNHSSRPTYERYGSHSVGSRSHTRGAFKESKSGPRSISQEELALNDLDAALHTTVDSGSTHAVGSMPRRKDSRHIVVTTETLVRSYTRDERN